MTYLNVQTDKQNIDSTLSFIEKEIKKRKIEDKNIGPFLLYSEELILQLIDCSKKKNNTLHIRISGKKKNVRAQFSCSGKELVFTENPMAKDLIDKAEFDEEQTIALSKMIIKANSDKINIRYKKGINIAQLNSSEKSHRSVSLLVWMLSGLLFGFLLKKIGNSTVINVSSDVFSTVSDMFMNAVKMLVTPLVFFLIADSISGFSDVSVFGKIGGKIVGTFIGLSVIALSIAFAIISVIKPGNPELISDLARFLQTTETTSPVSVSFLKTISDFIPSGFVSAFVNQNMTQIIFLAIFSGLASGKIGQYSEKVQSFFTIGASFFSKLIETVIKTLKPVCFCILANIALTISSSSFFQQFLIMLSIILGLLFLMISYGVFITVVGKLNPFKFFKKIKKAFLVAITTMSGSTTIPTSMQCCEEMGISPKVYSFSIPLGASIGKCSSCMLLMSLTLFITRIVGITLTPISILTLSFTIILLIICSPGIPGASLACLTIILTQLGIPNGAVGYIIGVYTLVESFNTAVNVTGVATTSLIVAKSEKLLNVDKFNS